MRVLENKDIVRLLRIEIGRVGSQMEWAKQAGVDRATVNKILCGKKPPTKRIIQALKLRLVVVAD
jgi:predicted transcriptional regulator